MPMRPLTTLTLLAAAVLLTGCATSASAGGDGGTATPSASGSPASAYPLTVDNCGTDVTFETAPERVLAIKSTSIEMLLALGLESHIIGTAFSDGPAADEWAGAAAELPVVAERVPGQEATLELEPDLVYAGWESNVTADGAGDRATLASLGVATYVSPAACREPAYKPTDLSFDDVFAEITEVGDIFDVPDRAAALIAVQRNDLANIEPDERGLTALWYSSGSDTPYVGAGAGAPQMMLDAAGLTNIAGDVEDAWTSLSWEAVVDANPDVIVLVDSAWGSAEKKIGVLESNPATAALDAVREGRYLIVPFPASEAGVRNVEGALTLVSQLGDIEVP